MNTQVKIAVAAVFLGLAGSASAAVLNTGLVLGTPSDVVLQVVDNTAGANFEKTFVADLELTYADLVNGVVTNKTWNLLTDSKYSAAFAGYQGHDLTWTVVGGYKLDDAGLTNFDKSGAVVPFSDPANAQWGGIISAKNGAELDARFNPIANYSGGPTAQIIQGVVSDNINGPGQNGKSATVDPTVGLGSLYAQNVNFGSTISLTLANHLGTTGANGGSGSLFWLTTTDPSDTTGTITNLGSLSLDSNTGVLTFGAAAPVPVPAAVWLFGSAIAGFLGLSRRNQKA